jgi:H+-transporting ATPase
LLAEGLSTIVDGIKESRAIFQRMRSYALYRIASTIHFLLFFFISILVYGFVLPDLLIIMIAVLNDAATLVIAVDNAKISERPDKWRLGQLLSLSFVLGFLLMLVSFAHFFVAKAMYPFDATHHEIVNLENLKYVQTIMYLQISSCPHFVIFSTRLGTWWWKSAPSWFFSIAIIGTQIIAGAITLWGPSWLEAVPIGFGWTFGVLAVSGVVKVMTFRYWSFELTAKLWPVPSRTEKLRKRQEKAILSQRVKGNTERVKKAYNVIRATNTISGGSEDKK